jgi:hypothetical protein
MENKKKMALIAEIMKSYKGKKNEEKMFDKLLELPMKQLLLWEDFKKWEENEEN